MKGMKKLKTVLGLSLALGLFSTSNAYALDAYEVKPELTGKLVIRGSDTVGKAAKQWVQAFKAHYPNVNIDLTEAGSGDGAKAVIGGTADIGNMSRKMKSKELKAFEESYGYKPTEIRVGVDAVGVVVHKDNPATEMSLEQIDALFSATASCGGGAKATWGDVGISGDIASAKPDLKIRNPESGTRSFFVKKALCGGDFKDGAAEFKHSSELVAEVGKNKSAIGFTGIADVNGSVKALALKKGDKAPVAPDADNVANGKYPLSRYLFMYVNKVPGQNVNPVLEEFIKFIVSTEGQEILSNVGYIPINDRVASSVMKSLL